MSYSEKRRYPRLGTDNLISYYLVDENGKIYSEGLGKAKNISKVGILLVTGKLVDSNYILILATDEKNKIIEMKGKIAYSKKDDSGLFFTGIEFLGNAEENYLFAKSLLKTYRINQNSTTLTVQI
jgi:hypothetical protein